jgi:hypothetical protein
MSLEPAAQRLARVTFETTVRRDVAGIPRVPPEFVAEQGQYVRIIDVRDPVAALDGGMAAWKKLGFSTPRDGSSVRLELKRLPPGVGRSGRPLVPVEKGTKLTASQILDHVGDPGTVRWVKLAAFLLHGKRSCVDGRDDHGVIGTPGGDAGELMLALAAAEAVRGSPLSDEHVEQVLRDHLDTFGRFYMHSDMHAMNHLIVDGLRKDPRVVPYIEKVFEAVQWRAFHSNPPAEVREALLEHLVKPENMGCGHLRFALTEERYGVRPGLSRALLRAFHTVRWSGAPELEWVVLGGEHVEGAVVEVVVEGELHSYTRIPLVSPQVDGMQMFVSHPQVTAHLRRETASFLVETGLVPASDERRLLEEIGERGNRQLEATLGKLAHGLPVYRIRFADGKPGVEQVGVVD